MKKFKVVVIVEQSQVHIIEAQNAAAAAQKISNLDAVEGNDIRSIEQMPDDTKVTIK